MSDSTPLQNLELALIELEYAVADLVHKRASTTNQNEVVQLETALSALLKGKETLKSTLKALELAAGLPGRAA